MTSITPISATDFSTYDGSNYQAMRGIASSSDGKIIYVSIDNGTDIGVVKSIDSGANWSIVYPYTRGFTSIACSSDGTIVYVVSLGEALYKSTDSGDNWNIVTFLPNNTLPGGSANPESPDGGAFPGYDLTNIYQIACDSTGTKLIMTTNAAASIYQSTNGGSNWEFLYAIPGYSTNPMKKLFYMIFLLLTFFMALLTTIVTYNDNKFNDTDALTVEALIADTKFFKL